jgi:DNA topoisomerase VI subunit B
MKTKLREKIGALVLLAGCMILVLTISGFTPERQIIPGGIPSDTVPDAYEQKAEEMEKALEEIDWEEIEAEIRDAGEEAMAEIDWEAMKLEIEQARKEALEDIDWEEIREEMSTARMQIDSAVQELELEYDFDFDMDFDFEIEEIRIDMEKALKELEEIDIEEIREEIERTLKEIDTDEIRKQVERDHL